MSYTDEFIEKIAPHAMRDMRETGILASLTLAQAILESNWGRSELATEANNLFGIKGSYKGQSVKMWTHEYYNGERHEVEATFRKYPSVFESLQDHTSLFLRLDRYENLIGVTDYKRACVLVRKDGYATDPAYTDKLINLIESYNLDDYDEKVLQAKQDEADISPRFVEARDFLIKHEITDGSSPKEPSLREHDWAYFFRFYNTFVKPLEEEIERLKGEK